ncbi:hypothetical protein LTR36_008328 [Oleoguttula mirabilis]|uniref:CID domain-containing protein n=1 Tax=Oleoguttula mirabilis TaxID=1507867 RepID=A0AAV9J7S2_9PEZI|nr:hypothetical protein LTR36_008328 [Oleoguttula mirabilis]
MAQQTVRETCRAFATAGKAAEIVAQDAIRAINSCTRQHIERCTTSAIRLMRSAGSDGATAFCKFLVALGKDLQSSTKRLHILHITSDICLAIQQHRDPFAISGILKRHVPLLLTLATYVDPVKDTKTYTGVMELIGVWHDNQVFQPDELLKLYERVLEADAMSYCKTWEDVKAHVATEELKVAAELARELEDAKWTLPKRHGVPNDPTAPWYELPAANGLYMKRTRGYPLRSYALPQGGYELGSGVDRSQLKTDVEKLHSEMLHAFDKYTNADDVQDIDAVGNIIYKDPERPTRNYWGWSLDAIEKRKELSKHFQDRAVGYADVPIPRRSGAVDADVERARRMAADRASGGMPRGGGRGGNPRGGWGGRGGYGGPGFRGGRGSY